MVAPVELFIQGETPIESYLINLSKGGICLHTNRFIRIDTELSVLLSYLLENGNRAFEGIKGKVKFRWLSPLTQGSHREGSHREGSGLVF